MNNLPNDPSNWPSVALFLANLCLVGVTFLLVVITFLYMLFTGKMATRMSEQVNVQKREFDLKIRPVPDIKAEVVSTSGTVFRIRFRIFNGGLSPFYLSFIGLKFRHSEMPERVTADIHNVNRYIFPQAEHISGELEYDYKKDPIPGFKELKSLKGAYISYHIVVLDLENKTQRFPKDPDKDPIRFLE